MCLVCIDPRFDIQHEEIMSNYYVSSFMGREILFASKINGTELDVMGHTF